MVSGIIEPLLMGEILFHCIRHRLELLRVFKLQFLFSEVFLVIKLALEASFFVFKHLSVALFHESTIVVKLFFPLSVHSLMLSCRADHYNSFSGLSFVGW